MGKAHTNFCSFSAHILPRCHYFLPIYFYNCQIILIFAPLFPPSPPRFFSSFDVICQIRYPCHLYPYLLDDKGSGFFCDKQWGLSKPHKAPVKDVCSAARTVVICRMCSFSKLDRPGYCQITAIYFQMFLLGKKKKNLALKLLLSDNAF